MKEFYYIERVQQWININKIITVFRIPDGWSILLEGNHNVPLNETEYAELETRLKEPVKPEEKKTEEGQE